jgi:hypothetical protein
MAINVTTEILEKLFIYALTAERLTKYIHNTIVVDALTKSINKISRVVAGLLGKPVALKLMEDPTQGVGGAFNFANALDDLRQLVMRADTLANATESLFEKVVWVEIDGDSRRLEHLAHLIGATAEAAREAMELGDTLAVKFVTRPMERSGAS